MDTGVSIADPGLMSIFIYNLAKSGEVLRTCPMYYGKIRAQIDDIFDRTKGFVKIQCQSRADCMGMKQLCGEL